MSLEEQLNAMARLILFIFIIQLLFDFKYAIPFLVISLVFIIILYYIQKRTMQRCQENYNETKSALRENYKAPMVASHRGVAKVPQTSTGPQYRTRPVKSRTQYFCGDEVPFNFNDPNYVSKNQILANGGKMTSTQNPKTKIAPVVIAPSHALDYWKSNNLITHSAINDSTQQDDYLSGYAVSTCCGNLEGKTVGYSTNTKKVSNTPENYSASGMDRVEDFSGSVKIRPNEPGWINTSCGYNPNQVYESNLPSNLPAGNCPQNPNLKQFNGKLFTSTIQPGVYTKTQVNEPINSNIGISFQQQFEPVTCQRDGDKLTYTQHDPRIIEPVEYEPNNAEPVTESNVYDPRFNGYGTSYRSYTDPTVGQTRFMYDDVDAIRRPNYITRSKIDHLPYADSYGPMKPGQEFGNPATSDIRGLANDSFLRNSLQFRNEMMERLMRKRNAELWQTRQYPKTTAGGCNQTGGRV